MKDLAQTLKDLAWLLAGLGALAKSVLEIIEFVKKRRAASREVRAAGVPTRRYRLLLAIALGLAGAVAFGYGVARILTPDPLPAGCRQLDASYVECVVTSKGMSGVGKDWGQWYGLASPPPPHRYVFDNSRLENASFTVIAGDHRCSGNGGGAGRLGDPGRGKPGGAGSWAECYEERRDEAGVAWQFRIQGWEGNGSPGEGTAQLVAVYVRR